MALVRSKNPKYEEIRSEELIIAKVQRKCENLSGIESLTGLGDFAQRRNAGANAKESEENRLLYERKEKEREWRV